jgi:hypothetical protein
MMLGRIQKDLLHDGSWYLNVRSVVVLTRLIYCATNRHPYRNGAKTGLLIL